MVYYWVISSNRSLCSIFAWVNLQGHNQLLFQRGRLWVLWWGWPGCLHWRLSNVLWLLSKLHKCMSIRRLVCNNTGLCGNIPAGLSLGTHSHCTTATSGTFLGAACSPTSPTGEYTPSSIGLWGILMTFGITFVCICLCTCWHRWSWLVCRGSGCVF